VRFECDLHATTIAAGIEMNPKALNEQLVMVGVP
jgi:hypothetical protein